MSLSRPFDFCGLTFYSYMIDIIFLDIFGKYSVIQFYLTATYCLRYANHPLGLRGFKSEIDIVSIFRDPEAYWKKSTKIVIVILIITLKEHVLFARHCRKFLSFIYLKIYKIYII